MDFSYEIKERLHMSEVAAHYGLEVNRSGFARCPFHHEKTASLKIYSGKGGFYCYGCGAHGSVIDFVMQFFDLGYWDAVKKINADFGLYLPIDHKPTLRQARTADAVRKKYAEEKAKHEMLDAEYDRALTVFAALDRAFTGDPADREKLDRAKYELDEAERRLFEYENGR